MHTIIASEIPTDRAALPMTGKPDIKRVWDWERMRWRIVMAIDVGKPDPIGGPPPDWNTDIVKSTPKVIQAGRRYNGDTSKTTIVHEWLLANPTGHTIAEIKAAMVDADAGFGRSTVGNSLTRLSEQRRARCDKTNGYLWYPVIEDEIEVTR